MKINDSRSNLSTVLILVFLVLVALSLIIKWLFGFEVALLVCLSGVAATITTSIVGVENVIILTNSDNKLD